MTFTPDGRRLVSITEAARLLKTSRGTVYRRIRDGELRGTRYGGRVYLTANELDRFLSEAKP